MIVVSLVTVALSALSASAFRPPAFCVGRVTAVARAKTTVVAYADNADSKDERISKIENRLKESEAENLNLKFSSISDKIDVVDGKISNVAKELKDVKIGLDRKIDDVGKELKDVAKDLKTVSKELSTINTVLVAIACICVVPQLPTFLAFLK
jgi:wobble nucleotide-excising tRNase